MPTKTARKSGTSTAGLVPLEEVAKRAHFDPRYFAQRVAGAYRLDPIRQGDKVLFHSVDVERALKQIRRDRNGSASGRLRKGALGHFGKSNGNGARTRARSQSNGKAHQNGAGPVIQVSMSQLRSLMREGTNFTFQVTD